MRRSPLVLTLALAAVTACGSDSPTNPPLFIPDVASGGPQILQGVLELTQDDPPLYSLVIGGSGRVILNCDLVVIDETMLGTFVLVRGRYGADGAYIVESLHSMDKPTDIRLIATGMRQPY